MCVCVCVCVCVLCVCMHVCAYVCVWCVCVCVCVCVWWCVCVGVCVFMHVLSERKRMGMVTVDAHTHEVTPCTNNPSTQMMLHPNTQ